jgi:hypothetical protein
MISSILRIFYWFTDGYAINLLFQAIILIVIQVFMFENIGIFVEAMCGVISEAKGFGEELDILELEYF